MGVEIILGGGAGQFGSGLGKGLNEGIDAKLEQVKADAEKQALADDFIAAMKMLIAPKVEALEGQIPAQIEPQGPLPDPGAGPLAVGVHGPPAPPVQGPPAPPVQGPPAPPDQGPPAPPAAAVQGPPDVPVKVPPAAGRPARAQKSSPPSITPPPTRTPQSAAVDSGDQGLGRQARQELDQGPPAPPAAAVQGPPAALADWSAMADRARATAAGAQGPPAPPDQGSPAPPNAVPEYMRPQPNPEREQLDAIVQQFARGVSSLREPEAIKLAAQVASQQLDMLQRQILVKKVNDQLAFAQKTGGFDNAEIQNFLNMGLAIAQGEGDITDLYSAIRELKEEKVKQAVDFARATSFIEDNAKTVVSLAMSSGAESDPTIAGWFTNQAGLLKDKLVSMQSALKFGLDDFDFDAASKEVLDIKHALNPYQEAKFKQQLEQETLRMRNYYNELEDIRSDQGLTDTERKGALEAAKKAYGSDAPAQSNVGGRGQSGGPSTPLLGDIYRAGPGSFGTTLEEIENTGGRVFYGAAKQVADVAGYEFSKNFSVSMPKDDFVDEVVGLVKHLKANGNEEFAMSFAGTMMDGIKLWEDEKRKAGGFKPETSVVDPETGTPVSMDQTTRIISDPQVERFKKQYYGQPR
jgi:hypothetical protein